MVDNELVIEPGVVAREFNEYFQSMVTIGSFILGDDRTQHTDASVMEHLSVRHYGILNALLNLEVKMLLVLVTFRVNSRVTT